MEKPNCFKCKHYFVTFDKYAPRGCRIYQIKSKDMPTTIVKASSGEDCQGFEAKPDQKSKDKGYE